MAGLNVALPKPTILQPSEQENQLVQGYRQETQNLEQRLAPIQREKAQLEGEMRSIQPAPPPKLMDMPQFQARQVDGGEMMAFAGIATALAALGAKAVRGDITVALTAAGSAIEGFNKGNLQQAKLDIEQFNTKMRSVIAQNNKMLGEYTAVMQDRKLTLSQKMQQYQVLATKYQDEIAMTALRKGDLKMELDRAERIRTATNQAEMIWQRTNATLMAQALRLDAMQKRGGIGGTLGGEAGGLTQDASEYLSAYVTLNGRMPVGFARMTPALAEIMNTTAAAAKKVGLTAEDWAAAGPITKQKLSALGQLEKNRNAIQAFEGMLDKNIDILKTLSKKVSRSDSPYANRPIIWLQNNAAGDPDVAEYLFQVNTVSTEIARILTNPNMTGQLTDQARKELETVVNGALSPQQMEQVLNRAQADARNRSAMLDAQENKVIAEIRDPLHAAGGVGGQVIRKKSRSGRPIISNDGGKTWEYAD